MSSTVDRIENSKTSVCREFVSKTRSKVKAPAASLDCEQVSVEALDYHLLLLNSQLGVPIRNSRASRTLMLHVSSVSKFTI